METNYKVKHRRILMPLKLMLLLVAVSLFGYTSYSQGQSAKVSNIQELVEALDNPFVSYVILEESFQGPTDAAALAQRVKALPGSGGRDFQCAYVILDNDTCFFDPSEDNGWVTNTAGAFSVDLAGTGGCPGDDDGSWGWNTFNPDVPAPPGASLEFLSAGPPYVSDTTDFRVDNAGVYTLRYSWGAPWNSYAQTEYKFYSPFIFQELSADDVCGLCTDVDLEISAYYGDPEAVIYYELWNPCTGQRVDLTGSLPALDTLWYYDDTPPAPYPIDNDTTQIENFQICAPDYGNWKFIVTIDDGECAMVADTIDIVFAIEPVADAGPDVEVCDDMCVTLIGSAGSMFANVCYRAPNFAYSWVQISGPVPLTFTPHDAETTLVCGTTDCWYGMFEVEFQVQNGECYDSDTMNLYFYEEPTADAGPDQFLCEAECFTMDATPYVYCSPEIDEERYAYWQIVSLPPGVTVAAPPPYTEFDPDAVVCITDPGPCPYGEYVFEWIEVNGTCEARDTVSVFIFEEPVADAGEDSLSVCFYEGCYTVYGTPYQYCNEPADNFTRTHMWELTGWPAGFDPNCSTWGEVPGAAYMFEVCPCGPCPWGEYEVTLYEYNNGPDGPVCMDVDVIHFFLFEPPTADAGDDFTMCYTGGCFSMGAMPFSYCSDPAPEWGERYGEWTKIAGPAAVEFVDPMNPEATACPDEEDDCPFGVYTFQWTEYNGDCMDADEVVVTLFETPIADAGDDAWYCVDWDFSMDLWHTFAATPYQYCQDDGLENYAYWSKCGGPGYVTWYNEDTPDAWVHVSCYGCYCFEYVEVNGDCETRDTIEVCWYEHPYLMGEDLVDSACTELPVCYDLGQLGIVPYEYDACENYNHQYWTMVYGGGTATYTPDETDPGATVCVDNYGCYSFQFIQYNGVVECADTLQADLWFFEDPVADAGPDDEICDPCYMLSAMPYSYVVTNCHPADDAHNYWMWYTYIPPDEFCEPIQYSPCIYEGTAPLAMYQPFGMHNPSPELCVCDDYLGSHYGTYGFIWTEINGECMDMDTVYITFKKNPDPLPISGCVEDAICGDYFGGPGGPRTLYECGCAECWFPEEGVMTVCANTCGWFNLFEICGGGWNPEIGEYVYDWCGPCGLDPIPGYTYEWSFTGPSGSYFDADPFWYDCTCGWRGNPNVYLCFGECCDTARLYLTITTPEGCTTTEEWKFYVQHPPDATISGPEIAEVSSIFEYSIPDPANPCYLYVWEVQHCGEIVYGQGTGTIGVHWTDYNENGGWGIVSVEVYDTCTCCCNIDEMMVRVLPQGSLGDGTLEGYVYYDNNYMTPLNGVMLTLWNAGVPIFETYSFNDIEDGNGMGYYKFEGINETTEFGLTADYGAPWYGANATDALAIELKVINPGGYTWNAVQDEAGDVNASTTLSATDALWVKQRAIAMVGHFPAGDWAFAEMSSTAGTYDVMTLNYGDVNRSNIPSSTKEMPAITLVTDGTINVVPGEVFEMPIRVAEAVDLGAITMNLGFNSNLVEVVEVLAVEGALNNISSTNVALAWSDVNPMVLNNNDAIVSLRLKALGEIATSDQLFTIELGTEFADPQANVLEDLTLKTFGISTDPAVADYFLSYNRPNPFSTSTQIEYALPENGKVRLSVVDLLGQEIATLINQTQSAGSYTVQFNAAGLTPGVYIYKITVQGDTRDFVETRRMVISH